MSRFSYLFQTLLAPMGGWTPLSVPGLAVWLDADQLTGLSDDDPIATWNDVSGGGNDVTQGVAGSRPAYKVNVRNGRPVARFDGSDWMSGAFGAALSQPFHVIAVARSSAAPNIQYILDSDDGVNRMAMCYNAGPYMIFAGAALLGGASDTNWNIWTARYNGLTSSLRINGTGISAGNAGVHNADGLTIGSRWDQFGGAHWIGDIAEVLIYDTPLSDANLARVERYLSRKYAIAVP